MEINNVDIEKVNGPSPISYNVNAESISSISTGVKGSLQYALQYRYRIDIVDSDKGERHVSST